MKEERKQGLLPLPVKCSVGAGCLLQFAMHEIRQCSVVVRWWTNQKRCCFIIVITNKIRPIKTAGHIAK